MINLVSNAVAYGDPGGPIVVGTTVKEGSGFDWVHNEGSPIPAHMLETIFEPMVRGVPGSSPHRSVGLGLFILNEIARAHHKKMTVQSKEGSGSTFTLTFGRAAVAYGLRGIRRRIGPFRLRQVGRNRSIRRAASS